MWGRVGAPSARLGQRRAEAQEAEVGLVGWRSGPVKPVEQRGRIVRQVARKRRDLGLAVEAVRAPIVSPASGVPMMAGSLSRPRATVASRVARTAASATTSTFAPENFARSIARSVMRARKRSSRSWLA